MTTDAPDLKALRNNAQNYLEWTKQCRPKPWSDEELVYYSCRDMVPVLDRIIATRDREARHD